MIPNEIILKFIDYICEYTNKVSSNDFGDKYLILCCHSLSNVMFI